LRHRFFESFAHIELSVHMTTISVSLRAMEGEMAMLRKVTHGDNFIGFVAPYKPILASCVPSKDMDEYDNAELGAVLRAAHFPAEDGGFQGLRFSKLSGAAYSAALLDDLYGKRLRPDPFVGDRSVSDIYHDFWDSASRCVATLDCAGFAETCSISPAVVDASPCEASVLNRDVISSDFGYIVDPSVVKFVEEVSASQAKCVQSSDGPCIKLGRDALFSTNLGHVTIHSPRQADWAVEFIRAAHSRASAISVRVEYSDDGQPLLIQVCAGDICFLFRLQWMHTLGLGLAALLADPHILKIGYCLGEDVISLRQHLGVSLTPTLDVMSFGCALGYSASGLRRLVFDLFGKQLIKYKSCNWNWLAYNDRMLRYAVDDCVAPLACYQRLLSMCYVGYPCYGSSSWPVRLNCLIDSGYGGYARRSDLLRSVYEMSEGAVEPHYAQDILRTLAHCFGPGAGVGEDTGVDPEAVAVHGNPFVVYVESMNPRAVYVRPGVPIRPRGDAPRGRPRMFKIRRDLVDPYRDDFDAPVDELVDGVVQPYVLDVDSPLARRVQGGSGVHRCERCGATRPYGHTAVCPGCGDSRKRICY